MADEPAKRIANPAFDAWMAKEGGGLLDKALKDVHAPQEFLDALRGTLASLLRVSWVQSEMAKLNERMTDDGNSNIEKM